MKKRLERLFKSSFSTILLTCLLFSTVFLCIGIKAEYLGGATGGSVGGSSDSYSSSGIDYQTAVAYAFYVDSDAWLGEEFQQTIMNGQKLTPDAIETAVYRHYKRKYPSWSEGTRYLYILPVEQTPGESENAPELEGCTEAYEVDSNYSGFSNMGNSNVWHTHPSAVIEPNWSTDGRGWLYDELTNKHGNNPNKLYSAIRWKEVMNQDQALNLLNWLTAGGSAAIRDRARQFMYVDAVPNQGAWVGWNEEDVEDAQICAYLDLMAAMYELSNIGYEPWESQVQKFLDMLDTGIDPVTGAPTGCPIICVDRAIGFRPLNAVFDGPDYFQYAVGMNSTCNLRMGWPGNESIAEADSSSLIPALLNWLDANQSGRPVPIRDAGAVNSRSYVGPFGPPTKQLGLTSYNDALNGKAEGLWAELRTWNMKGFNLIYSCASKTPNVGKGRHGISTDEPKTITLPKGSKTIGQDVTVHFEANQNKTEAYKKILEDLDKIDKAASASGTHLTWQLGVNIYREATGDSNGSKDSAQSDTLESEDDSVISLIPYSDKDDTSKWVTYDDKFYHTDNFNDFKAALSSDNFCDFIDHTTDDTIHSYRRYDYYSVAKVRISKDDHTFYGQYNQTEQTTLKTDANGWIDLMPDPGHDYAEFKVNDNPYHYDSDPVDYSEVKQNEPMKEEWEAMSGTPTDKPLYFTSGGSEFAVTIDCTPMEGYLTRNYTCSFPTWKDEHNGTCDYCKNCGSHPGYWETHTTHHSDGTTSTSSTWVPPVYCHCSAGGQSFSWTQKINYSYMRINNVRVWRVKTSAVTGMKELTPMNADDNGDIVAQICKGDEDNKQIYASIFTDTSTEGDGSDRTGSSEGGRIHWTEQPDTKDPSYKVCNSGSSTEPWGKGQPEGGGSCGEKKTVPQAEIADYNALKNGRKNEAYVQSDYVILHTKEGDLVLNYSEAHGKADNLFDDINCKMDTNQMWWQNKLCPSMWSPTEINQVWYNGNYQSPQECFQRKVSPFTFKEGMFSPMEMHYYESKTTIDKEAYGDGWLTKQVKHDIDKPTGDQFNDYPMNVRWTEAMGGDSNQENHKVESETCDPYDCTGEDMQIWRQFNPLLTYKNGEYDIGHSSVLYERIIAYEDSNIGLIQSPLEMKHNSDGTVYYYDRWDSGLKLDDEAKYAYEGGKKYLVCHSSYCDEKTDCNDIVIHDPVSSEYSYVLTLPKERDQRTDRSKALSASGIEAMSSADSIKRNKPNPNYHNNLLFNPFDTSSKVDDSGNIGWSTSIGTALGWLSQTRAESGSYNFNCDTQKGIIIENKSNKQTMYYQDIKAISGDTYKLTYDAKALDGNKASVYLLYLDGSGKVLDSSEGALTVRVCIDQSNPGKTLVNNLVLYDMTTGGFIPNTTKVYDEKYVIDTDTSTSFGAGVTTQYHYTFKDLNTDKVIDAYTNICASLGDKVSGNDLRYATDSNNVIPSHEYVFTGYTYSYIADAKDSLEDGLLRITGKYAGHNLVKADGSLQNTVVGKAYRYTGNTQIFIAPEDGWYYLEAWGAHGGDSKDADGNTLRGGKGTYQDGLIQLKKDDILEINVGGRGNNLTTDSDILQIRDQLCSYMKDGRTITDEEKAEILDKLKAINDPDKLINRGGFNGGGYSTSLAASGGGASDIRRYTTSDEMSTNSSEGIENRILVAGGGAGCGWQKSTETQNISDTLWAGQSSIADAYNHLAINETNIGSVINGAGGGGYYGGNAETTFSAGSAGSNYKADDLEDSLGNIDKATQSYDGNGKVQITYMKYFTRDGKTNTDRYYVKQLSEHQYDNTVPNDAYIQEENTAPKAADSYVKDDFGNVKGCDTFINLDYGFSIYFPNTGDFEENPDMHGILDTTDERGLGFKNSMDTTEWTYCKYVQFPFDVVHRNTRYSAGDKIYLDVNKEYFDFYCTLGNEEQAQAKVKMVSIAINNQDVKLKGASKLPDVYKDGKVCYGGSRDIPLALQSPENDVYKTPMDSATDKTYILNGTYVLTSEHNSTHTGHYEDPHTGKCLYEVSAEGSKGKSAGGVKQKDSDCYAFKQYEQNSGAVDNQKKNNNAKRDSSLAAKHSSTETDIIDVVGRIGNCIIDDVGDPRFAEFFKQEDGTGNFIWPGVVRTVDASKQNNIVGDQVDIRGVDITKQNNISDSDSSEVVSEKYNRGESKNTKDSSLRDSYQQDFWTNLQNEPGTGNHKMPKGEGSTCPQKDGRPGNGYGDSSNDPLGQTTFNQDELLGGTAVKNNAYLNTYAHQGRGSDTPIGLHDNEFGQLPYKDDPLDTDSFPLVGKYNNIQALKDQELRIGYPVYQDIQTIGSYGEGHVQISPYYYALDLDSDPDSPTLIPVDIYMAVNDSYKPINLFGASQIQTENSSKMNGEEVDGALVNTVTSDKSKVGQKTGYKDKNGNELKYKYIYDNKQFIDWDNENIRRNSSIGISQTASEEDFLRYADIFEKVQQTGKISWEEEPNTKIDGKVTISQEWKNSGELKSTLHYGLPYSMYYATGNNQILNLNSRCRTFVGDTATYNTPINRVLSGNKDKLGEKYSADYDPHKFMKQGQRWHFVNNLPSSAVAVRAGSKCNSMNIKELRQDKYVLLTALDIKAVGSVWTLQYEDGGGNSVVKTNGKTYKINSIDTGKVVTVTSMNKSSKDDRNVAGTH